MSAIARFRPLAPVGGTMCAASPARKSRPYCIGSTTKLRMPVTPFSRIGPSSSVQPSSAERGSGARPRSARPTTRRRPRPARTGGSRRLRARRAQAEEREAALVVRVDELVDRRRDVREDAEPAERVLARERRRARRPGCSAGRRRGSRRSRRSRRTRARAARRRGEKRIRGRSVSSSWTLTSSTSKSKRQPALEPRRDQVLDDLGLAVDDDRPAAGELARAGSGAARRRTGARSRGGRFPRACSRLADARLGEQVDGSLLEHACADRGARRSRGSGPRARPSRCPPARAAARASARPGRRRRCRPGCAPSSFLVRGAATCWKTAKALFAAGTPQ